MAKNPRKVQKSILACSSTHQGDDHAAISSDVSAASYFNTWDEPSPRPKHVRQLLVSKRSEDGCEQRLKCVQVSCIAEIVCYISAVFAYSLHQNRTKRGRVQHETSVSETPLHSSDLPALRAVWANQIPVSQNEITEYQHLGMCCLPAIVSSTAVLQHRPMIVYQVGPVLRDCASCRSS